MFSRQGRIAVDALLSCSFIASFGLQFTGEQVHELIGLLTFVLFTVHLIAGWSWIKNLLKGSLTIKRCIITLINVLLIITAMTILTSGLCLLLGGGEGLILRKIHTISAYWMLLLSGIHIGLYWERLSASVQSMVRHAWQRTGQRAIWLQKSGIVFSIYGIWASFERSMGEKLFSGFSFEFWPTDAPTLFFFINYLAIVSFYIMFARYAMGIISSVKKQS